MCDGVKIVSQNSFCGFKNNEAANIALEMKINLPVKKWTLITF